MELPDFLTWNEKGGIRLTGHRIDLYHIARLVEEGHSAEMVHHEYPSLSQALIASVMEFCMENKAAVDAYLAGVDTTIARHRADYQPGPGIRRLRELKEARPSSSS